MIGLSLADLTKIPDTVILASGEEKILAIKALLKNRIIDHLIIDASIAEAL
jgi:DNA-binding transcriptional regulator LsrR (DeoR family)